MPTGFVDPQDGLRVISSADQIAQFEFAAVRVERAGGAAARGGNRGGLSRPCGAGLPMSCHPMIGWREGLADLSSPSANAAAEDRSSLPSVCRGSELRGAVAGGPDGLSGDADFYRDQ
jgi:hypothetical protein